MSDVAGSTLSLQEMKSRIARKRIESFRNRFTTAHLDLAYHAAFPLALTPDLLYRLWMNFKLDNNKKELKIPREAVADLLLSGLCTEVGHELYKIDADVRSELLAGLKTKFDPSRIKELSKFLLKYIQQEINRADPDFAQAQKWLAQAYTEPVKAAREIVSVLREQATTILRLPEDDRGEKAEMVRLASLVGTFAEPMAEEPETRFTSVLAYVQGMVHFVHGDIETATTQFDEIAEGKRIVLLFGESLPIPGQVLEEVQKRKDKGARRDFFISYHRADRAWAEWIAWQLEKSGYSIVLDVWDFPLGTNLVVEKQKALEASESIIVLLSPDYLNDLNSIPEWTVAFKRDPAGEKHILLPVRVRDCRPAGLLAPIVYIDLVGLNESAARKSLLAGVRRSAVLTHSSDITSRARHLVSEPPSFPQVQPPRVTIPTFPRARSPLKKHIEVIISYAPKDNKMRDELEKVLSGLKLQGAAIDWYAWPISPEWRYQLDAQLNSGQIILLLISVDYLSSSIIYGSEMKRLIERHKAGAVRVIPVILRPCAWEDTPFGKLQPLPKNGKPVTTWSNRDKAFVDLARDIRKVVEELAKTLSDDKVAPIWDIPYQRNPYFTGREDILTQLHDSFARETAPRQIQAICGLGGIGKTQIAIEYAYWYLNDYHFVLWARADSRESLISDFARIADRLNLPGKNKRDQHLIVNAVKRWLGDHSNWLLILDGIEDTAVISDFIPGEARGNILLTTRRQSLGTVAQGIELEKMQPYEGALLLLRRAKIIGASLENASAADRDKAREISLVMDGLPLALDQAGAYIEETACSLSKYLESYQKQPLALLKWRGDIISDHPESIATTLLLSFEEIQRVNPAASELLQFCAFLHPEAIPEEIITQGAPDLDVLLGSVAADPIKLNEAMGELRKFSLVHRNPEDRTFSVHRLVQTVLKENMNNDLQRLWAERAVRAVNRAFPNVEFATWTLCQRCLPHAYICANLIEQWRMTFPEAGVLLDQTGYYLWQRGYYNEAGPFYQRAVVITEKMRGREHPDTATTFNALAVLYRTQSKYGEAESLFRRALAIREEMLGPSSPYVTISLNGLAVLYRDLGKYSQAEPLFMRALNILEQGLGSDNLEVAANLNDIAALYCAQGKYLQAESLVKRAVEIREQRLGLEHPDMATSLNDMAVVYYAQGKYTQAEPLFQQALDIRQGTLGLEHPDVATSLNDLAKLYCSEGKYAEAEPLFKRALYIRQRALGSEHPVIATSLNDLAVLYCRQAKYAEAEPLFQQALDIRQRVLGPEHPDTARSLDDLGELYYTQGKYAQAESLLLQGLAIREKALGQEHPDTAASLNDLAVLYRDQRKYDQAQDIFERALYIREKALGQEHPDTAASLNDLAVLYRDQGKYKHAEALSKQAIEIRTKTLGSNHPDVAMNQNDLAMLYSEQGKYIQAEELFKRAQSVCEKILGPDHPATARVLQNYASLLQKTNRKSKGRKNY